MRGGGGLNRPRNPYHGFSQFHKFAPRHRRTHPKDSNGESGKERGVEKNDMQHRNYVYDTERRYTAAFREGLIDGSTKGLYQRFLQVKRELETNTEHLSDGERHFRMGLAHGWAEKEQARRACNGNETELGCLSRTISLNILRLRRAAQCA